MEPQIEVCDGSSVHLSDDRTSSIIENKSQQISDEQSQKITRKQKLIFVLFCISNFVTGTYYALIGPFFPNEAAKKGVSATLTGLIFGVYDLGLVVLSPMFGKNINRIGGKFMYVSGVLLCGCCSVLFGFLDKMPSGTSFFVIGFLIRALEGVATSALVTATFSIISYAFPNKVATMFGTLEMFYGVGLMAGPPIGGYLYQVGGFGLPFISFGVLLVLIGIVIFFILEPIQVGEHDGGSILALIKSPLAILCGLLLMTCMFNNGFIELGLSPELVRRFNLTPATIGLVFLAGPGLYTASSPIWGIIVDKFPSKTLWSVIGGFFTMGFSFYLLGPAPFFQFPGTKALWVVIVSQVAFGIGLGTMSACFQLLTVVARDKGMEDNLGTFGVISGLFLSSCSLGGTIGPFISGALIDNLGFSLAATTTGSLSVGLAGITLVYVIITKCHKKIKEQSHEERRPLIAHV